MLEILKAVVCIAEAASPSTHAREERRSLVGILEMYQVFEAIPPMWEFS
jgi:hypothetical protein